MATIRCITIDDEPLALMQLRTYIARTPGIQLVEACHDVAQAEDVLATTDVDLIFLDINMPGINGMEWARSLGDRKPFIIFTTAYSEYALEGYRVDAVDYLLKPFSNDEFSRAVDKVRQRIVSRNVHHEDPPSDDLYVKEDSGLRRIKASDIVYIKSLSEYVQIFTRTSARPVTTFMSMRRLENLLPQANFMRVHRSYIINLGLITSVRQTKIYLEGSDVEIPLGESFKNMFNRYVERRLLNK